MNLKPELPFEFVFEFWSWGFQVTYLELVRLLSSTYGRYHLVAAKQDRNKTINQTLPFYQMQILTNWPPQSVSKSDSNIYGLISLVFSLTISSPSNWGKQLWWGWLDAGAHFNIHRFGNLEDSLVKQWFIKVKEVRKKRYLKHYFFLLYVLCGSLVSLCKRGHI